MNSRAHEDLAAGQQIAHLSHLGRVLSSDNLARAEALLQKSDIAQKHIQILDARVKLISPTAFAARYDELKFLQTNRKQKQDDRPCSRAARARTDGWRTRLWPPFGNLVRLLAIITPNGIAPAQETTRLLADHWRGTFSGKHSEFDAVACTSFLDSFATIIYWSGIQPPAGHTNMKAIQFSKHSAPGPDGIPFGAWKHAGPMAIASLMQIIPEVLNDGMLALDWNSSTAVFPHKNPVQEEFCLGAMRCPDDTRPLNLKNTDNKLVASAINSVIKGTLATQLHEARRGFLSGRNHSLNVIEVDAEMRASLHNEEAQSSAAVLFDFKSAFSGS